MLARKAGQVDRIGVGAEVVGCSALVDVNPGVTTSLRC